MLRDMLAERNSGKVTRQVVVLPSPQHTSQLMCLSCMHAPAASPSAWKPAMPQATCAAGRVHPGRGAAVPGPPGVDLPRSARVLHSGSRHSGGGDVSKPQAGCRASTTTSACLNPLSSSATHVCVAAPPSCTTGTLLSGDGVTPSRPLLPGLETAGSPLTCAALPPVRCRWTLSLRSTGAAR